MNHQITVGSDEYREALHRWTVLNTKRATTPLDVREQQEFKLLDAALERAELRHGMAMQGAHV